MAWTCFHDMNSGGGRKEDFSHLWIEAPESEALVIFYNRFGHSAERVTCTCCGSDYSITESETLEAATGYERDLEYASLKPPAGQRFSSAGRYLEPDEPLPDGWEIRFPASGTPISLAAFLERGTTSHFGSEPFLVIRAEEIKLGERVGSVPEQGYVWQD